MEKIIIAVLLLAAVGCTGINSNVATNIATDTAFVMALQNNPTYKTPVVAALNAVKVFLAGAVTYDQLLAEISRQFPGKYSYIGIVLAGYIETDKPVATSAFNMLDSYKLAVATKIDRLILLAGI